MRLKNLCFQLDLFLITKEWRYQKKYIFYLVIILYLALLLLSFWIVEAQRHNKKTMQF